MILSVRLDSSEKHYLVSAFSFSSFFFSFFWGSAFQQDFGVSSGFRALFTGPTNLFFQQNFH